VLANAVYFHADWLQPFDSHETSADAFTTAGGSTVSVPTMHDGQLNAPAAVAPGYEAVQLPYKGGRFAALAIMPKGQSLSDFIAGLTPDTLATIAGSLKAGEVDLSIPKFTTTSTLDLVSALRDLGISDAFGSGADFSPMSPQGVQVGQVVQRDYLSVTEKGTEAAAVTGLGMVATAVMQKQIVHLDHPFLFLVRDTKTGAILFASAVNDPATG
jgi:serpin B